jgi:hypothetical protein
MQCDGDLLVEAAMEPLSIGQLEAAINRARADAPARGPEGKLSHDVAMLGRLYGDMIYRRAAVLDVEALSDEEQLVLLRWL